MASRVDTAWRALGFLFSVVALMTLSACGGGGGGGGGITSGTALSGNVNVPTGVSPIPAPGQPALAITPPANVTGATVEVLDEDGASVATAKTDSDGNYTVNLEDGTYQVGVQIGSTTFFSPLRSVVIVRGSTIDGSANVAGKPTLNFELPAASTSIAGTVTESAVGVEGVRVQFVDSETNLVRFQIATDSSGAFALTSLPEGNFTVRLESTSIPSGFAAPSPIQLSINGGTASPATLSFALAAATITGGTVGSTGGAAPLASLSPDGELQPAFVAEAPLEVPAGAEIIVVEVGYGEVARTVVDIDGTYQLALRDGSYIVNIAGLGADVVAPAPIRITVKDGLIYTEESDTALDPGAGGTLDTTAHGVTASLTGTVTLVGDPVTTKVVAIDPETGGELISVKTNASGQYTLPLADGSYDIVLRTNLLPRGVVPPSVVRVAVESVADPANPIKEQRGTINDGVVDFALVQSSATIAGTVSDASANPLKDVRVFARKGGKIVARAVTASDGGYSLSLPLGTIDIGIVPGSLPTGFLRIDPSRVEVALNDGTPLITAASGVITALSFVLETRAANITGTVAFDFDGSTVVDADEGVGCTILVSKGESKNTLFTVPTDPTTGAYSLILPNGSYKITIDPQSIPPGTTPPSARRASVTSSAVTLGNGTTGASVAVNFTLAPRVATLTGIVTVDGVGVGVGLRLVDASTGALVRRARTDQLTGAYRMPLAAGAYRLRVNPETLPSGAAIPNPIELGVAADGTVSTDTGALVNPPTLNIAMTRTVATLTGMVTVTRSSETFPVEAPIQVRDSQDQTVLFELLTDPEDGSYEVKLLPGSWTLAVDASEAPPGVIPPAPVTVTVVGTTVTGNGVSSNTLDFAAVDTRATGVDIFGFVVDEDADVGVPAEVRIFDPGSGDAETNFLLAVLTAPDGSFQFRVADGTYELAVFPASLPTTAIPPASVVLNVQGGSVVENNTKTSAFAFTDAGASFSTNTANDGKIGFKFRDGATSGITISGTVQDGGANPISSARVVIKDSSTQEIVLDLFTEFATGTYATVLPLGSYELSIDPASLPFGLMAPTAKSVQAVDNGGTIVVTTNGGAVVTPDGSGEYVFDFSVITASQTLTGVTTDPAGAPIRVFVKILDAVTDEFIAGRWSNETTGAFSALLGPGAYKVRLDPQTLPFATASPGPINITVTASTILETSGTADDGAIAFQLISSSRTISGTVVDSGANPMGCFVQAFDIVSGLPIAGGPTTPATGAYSLSVPPGSYSVKVDPFSLPPGYTPSAPQTVAVTDASGTANFVVSISSICVTGRVVTSTNELPLAVFVQLKDAATSVFIAGSPTDFATGAFEICAPPGNYKLSIQATSLPSGSIQPASVTVQFGSATIVEADTTTIGVEANAANDGLVNFRVSDTDVTTLATLTGSVTLNPGSVPLGAFVVIEDATSGAFVTGTPTDPASGGAYSVALPDGNYKVLVDAFSVPPGLILPTPKQISVVGTTITQVSSAGIATTSSTVNFVLAQATNQLSGSVTLGGLGFGAVIRVVNPTTGFIMFETPTAPDGTWSLTVPNGTYQIGIAPFSLPPTLPVPAPVTVSVSDGFALESAGTPNDGIIPFVLTSSSTQLTGRVVDDAGARLFAYVFVVDPSSGTIIMEDFTSPSEEFGFQLIDGTYDIVVDPGSLPLDVVPPLPSTVTLSSGAFTLTTAGSGTMVDTDTIELTAALASGITALPIKIQDSGTPVSGFVQVRDAAGNVLFGLPIPATAGGADVFLGDGTYTLRVDPFSLPGGYAPPANKALVVSGGGATFTVDDSAETEVIFAIIEGTLQGKIVNAFLGGSQRVTLDLLDGTGAVLIDDITLTQDTNDATYGSAGDVLVGDGTYTLRLQRESGETPATVILASNKTVNVLNGVIQNPDDDPSTGTIDVNMTLPVIRGTISGTVDLAASPVEGLTVIVKDPVNQKVLNSAATDSNGDYSVAVPAGLMKLVPSPASLAAIAPTALPPSSIELSVSTAGSVTITGVGTCTGDPSCTGVDFSLVAFDPSTDALITGTVTAQQSSASTPAAIANANVFLVDSSGSPSASTLTDGSGAYSLIAPPGVWYVYIDTFGLSVGFPILPPPPVQVSVSGTTVTPSSTVDFNIAGATSMISGRVQTGTGAGIGTRLVVTPSSATQIPSGFVYEVFTDPEGNYFLPVGQGSKKLWVDSNFLPPGFVAPLPINFTVNGTTVTENNTAGVNNFVNDGIINPVVTAGGGTIRVVAYEAGGTTPVACFVELLKTASNPSDPPIFISGQGTDPATGIVNFSASNGSYFVKIDPWSLPSGLQSSDSIDVTVNGSTVTWAAGASLTSIDPGSGAVDHGTLFVASASGAVSGVIRTDLADPATAVPGVVIVLDASTGAFVRDAFASPSDGSYSMVLGSGVYDIFVDPSSIPSSLIAGPPERVTVSGASVAETFDTPDDGVVSFLLQASSDSLLGRIVDGDDAPIEAAVGLFSPDSSGEYEIFVTGTLSDFETGDFTIPVSNGTYQVRVDPGSVPPGLSIPAPVTISVTGSGISFPASATTLVEGDDTILVLALSTTAGGVSGRVSDSSDDGVPAFVIAEDATTGSFYGGSPTDENGDYSIPLPAGTFKIFVDPGSLPIGSVPPSQQQVTVASTFVTDVDFSIETAGANFTGYILAVTDPSIAIDCSAISGDGNVSPVSCNVFLVEPSPDSSQPPIFLFETLTRASDGFFQMPIGDGTYEIHVDGASLPGGMLPPPPVTIVNSGGTISVSGETLTCSDVGTQYILPVVQSAATLTGVVQDGSANPIGGVFVELIASSDGTFVTGMPTTGAGTFSLSLGAQSYELRVDPYSLPPGFASPAPIDVSVVGGSISVGTASGVAWDGSTMTITLSAASATVSGTVLDSSDEPIQARVLALDFDDQVIAEAWTSGAGAYSIGLAPGIYTMKVDSFSLPAGMMAPPSQTVDLFESTTATANFVVQGAPAAITGQVFYDDSGTDVGIPGYVFVTDSITGEFVTGDFAGPVAGGDEYIYNLALGEGSFQVQVDPSSVPSGFVVPSPVGFSVTINSVSGAVTISEDDLGDGSSTTDGSISFECISSTATFQGALQNAGGGAVSGYVYVELTDGSGTIVAQAGTDSSGEFDLPLTPGNFRLVVDPGSLPPAHIAPPPSTLTVVGSTITINGSAPTGPPHVITIGVADATLNGHVFKNVSEAVIGAFVVATESDSGAFVAGVQTDGLGAYIMGLVDGTYLIQIDPQSLPSGFIPPAPTMIFVDSGSIYLGEDATGTDITSVDLDLLVDAPAASVTINTINDVGQPVDVQINIRDAATDALVTSANTFAGSVSIGLPAGSYLVRVPSFSVPPGSMTPAPYSLTVNGDGTTSDSSGNPSDAFLQFVFQGAAASVNGVITLASDGSAIAGALVIAIDPFTDFSIAESLTSPSGDYFLDLPVGTFDLIVAEGFPVTAVRPAPFRITVSPGAVDPSGPIDFALDTAVGTLSGDVTLDGTGRLANVLIFKDNAGTWEAVTAAQSDENGAYDLSVPAGDLVAVAQLLINVLPDPTVDIIAPLPVQQTFAAPGPTDTTQDIAFFTPGAGGAPVSEILRGSITAAGAPYAAPVQLVYTGLPMAGYNSPGGDYRMAIMADASRVFTVQLFEGDMPSSFTAPTPVDITVDGSATPAVSGTGVVEDAPEFVLDFAIDVDGVALSGAITDWDSNPLAGIEVRSFDPSTGTQGPTTFTGTTGDFTIIFPEGSFEIELGGGLPSEAIRPAPVEVEVVDVSGTLTMTVDGVATQTHDIQLQQGVARLSGQLTMDGAPTDGEIFAYVAGAEIGFNFASGGSYEILLPAGDITVIAEPFFVTSGTILAAPYTATLADTGSLQEITHNFEYLPVSTNPGETINGRVLSDGVGIGAELEVFDDSDAFYGFVYNNPSDGFFEVSLAPGTYTIRVSDDDVPDGAVGTTSATVVVVDGGVSSESIFDGELVFQLNTTGTSVSGTVTDASGPLEDAVIRFEPFGDPTGPREPIPFAMTDASGNYAILLSEGSFDANLTPGSVPIATVAHPGVELEVGTDPITLDFTLEAAVGFVNGTVTMDGAPLADAEVWALDAQFEDVTMALSDENGDYTLPLAAGSYTIEAELDGDMTTIVAPNSVSATIVVDTVLSGTDFAFTTADPTTSQVLTIQVAQAGTTLPAEGNILRDDSGAFVFHQFWDAFGDGGSFFETALPLAFGTYQVHVTNVNDLASTLAPVTVVVDASGTFVDSEPLANNMLIFDIPGAPSGTVLLDDGMPASGMSVELHPIGGGMATSTTVDGEGEYEFGGIEDGSYWLSIGSTPSGTNAYPRPQVVTVQDGTVYPNRVNMMMPSRAGLLSGTVTTDSVGIASTVMVFDRGLDLVARVETDGSGGYSIALPAGSYTVMAMPMAIAGNEVPPTPAETTFTGDATVDIDFSTSAVSSALSGNVSFGGELAKAAVILYQVDPMPRPLWIATLDESGDYSMNVPDGSFAVALLEASIPANVVSFEPVAIVASTPNVTGTDPDGAAISTNTLDLDPFGMSSEGGVREAMSDLLQGFADRDSTEITAVLGASVLFNGMDGTALTTSYTSGADDSTGEQWDHLIGTVTGSADSYTVSLSGRESFTDADGELHSYTFDPNYSLHPEFTFTVSRVDGSSPWLVEGNGLHVDEAFIESLATNVHDDGTDTESTEVEFIISEHSDFPLTAAAVAGTGVVDGTLTEDDSFTPVEWFAYTDASGSGPSPFDTTFGSLVDGGTYTYTATYASGSDNLPLAYNAPTASLYPTVMITTTSSGDVMVTWADIASRLARPYATTFIELQEDQSGSFEDVWELDDLPAGQTATFIQDTEFTIGNDYAVIVGVQDVGGAIQEYELRFSYPPADIMAVHGVVTDASGPVAGIDVVATDTSIFQEVATSTTDGSGNYALFLPAGNYSIELVDSSGSYALPSSVEVIVTDTAGVLSMTIDGAASADGNLDFSLITAVATLSGNITMDGSPYSGSGTILAYVDGQLAVETELDPVSAGTYSITLPAGDVHVLAVVEGSSTLPATPFSQTIADTGSAQSFTHDFDFVNYAGTGGATFFGEVRSNGSAWPSFLEVVDSSGNLIAVQDHNGFWSMALLDGVYTLRIPTEDLPVGYTGPNEATVVVGNDTVVGEGVSGDSHYFVLNTMGDSLSGSVTDESGTGVADVTIQASKSSGEVVFAVTSPTGQYGMLLDGGEMYDVEVLAESLSAGTLVPSPVMITMNGSQTVDFTLFAVAGSVAGTVTEDGTGAAGVVRVWDDEAELISEVDTEQDGTYTIDLPEGDFTVSAELVTMDFSTVITPDPQPVTIAVSTSLTGIDFAFVDIGSGTSQTLNGFLTYGGVATAGTIEIFKDIGGVFHFFATIDTTMISVDETFVIALTAGTYQLEVSELDGQAWEYGPVEIVVSTTDIQLDGSPLALNELTINVPALSGTVLDSSGPVAALTVTATPKDGTTPIAVVTDADGYYEFASLTLGEYWLDIDTSGLAVGEGAPWLREVFVTSQGTVPSRADIGVPSANFTLSGTVTVDTVGTQSTVTVFDQGMRTVAIVASDGAGAYSVKLPDGVYTAFAEIDVPSGSEVPTVLAEVDLTSADVTHDIAFDSTQASETMTGTVSLGGVGTSLPLLIVKSSVSDIPIARVTPAGDGTYSITLPYDTFEVMLDPDGVPANTVAFEPVSIIVDVSGVAGTDPDGNAMTGNVLNLDPHGLSDLGEVREVVTDFFTALTAMDSATVSTLLDDAALWNGRDKATLLTEFAGEENFFSDGLFLDRVMVSVAGSADSYDVTIEDGRQVDLADNGAMSVGYWNQEANGSPMFTFTVQRVDSVSPWQFAGNGLSVDGVEVFREFVNIFDGVSDTTEEFVEFNVEQYSGIEITSASVAGTGIVDGTLSPEFVGSDDYVGYTDGSTSSPSPFSATMASLVDGETYSFTANFAAGSDSLTHNHNVPESGLYATITGPSVTADGVLLEWNDISAQMPLPVAEINVFVILDTGSGEQDIFELEGLVPGTNWTVIPEQLFQSGQDYEFEVEYVDIGGAAQISIFQTAWPMP